VPGASSAERASGGEAVFAADRLPSVFGEIYRVGPDGKRTNLSRSPYQDLEPRVSPDGRKVAFVSERDGRQGLYVVGIDGRDLTRISSGQSLSSPADLQGTSFAWAPDSKRLAIVAGRSATLYVMQPGRVARLLGSHYWEPEWSPDGRVITASRLPAHEGGHTYVQAFKSDGKRVWQVGRQGESSWSASGRFAVSAPGAMIRIYDEQGVPISSFAGRTFAWSPNGDRIASVVDNGLEVHSGDGRRLASSTAVSGLAANGYYGLQWATADRIVIRGVPRGAIGVNLLTGGTWNPQGYYGVFLPEGELIATRTGDSVALQIAPYDGGAARTVARVPGCFDDRGFLAAATYMQFTPDGRSLVYQSNCAEPFANLYSVGAGGGGLRRLTQVNEQESSPQVSPDGTRIAYARADYTGLSCKGCPSTIWVRDADGTHPRQLTPTQQDTWDANPRWSPDGSKILFSRGRPTSESTFVVSATGGPAQKVAGRPPDWGPMRSRDGRVAELEAGGRAVDIGGVRRFTLGRVWAQSLAWSPDGRQFVLTARANSTAPLDVYTVDVDGRHLKRRTWNLNASSATWRQ
jgi:Tol biopolymer transport system component